MMAEPREEDYDWMNKETTDAMLALVNAMQNQEKVLVKITYKQLRKPRLVGTLWDVDLEEVS
jgi:hypothetical protein